MKILIPIPLKETGLNPSRILISNFKKTMDQSNLLEINFFEFKQI